MPSATDGRATLIEGRDRRMLLLSMRRLADLVAFCQQYEFEDVAAEVTGADRVEPGGREAMERSRRVYKLARHLTRSPRLARALAPPLPTVRLTRDYELFFPIFNHAFELFALGAVPGWRERSRRAACFVGELWVHELPAYLLELLSAFDHVFLGVRHPVEEVSRIVGRPCSYLPLAADVLTFAPFPDPPPRTIDVCNIGRRSAVTHAALVQLAAERRIHYYYDTVAASGDSHKQRTFRVDRPREHRLLLASLLQRSRFFVANRGRINEPEFTQGRDEVSGRFYEGAAAGTVMLGEAPRAAHFAEQFGWPDVVIPLPFDSPDVGEVLARLDCEPERLERARRRNVAGAALRHDWVHRLFAVFAALGIAPTEEMRARDRHLRAIAALAADPAEAPVSPTTESALP